MPRKTSTQFVLTVICSSLAVTINYLILFLLTPYITENIGTEAFGFVSLAKNFAGYATILTIALNSFSASFISIEYHRGNMEQANRYYSSVFFANLMLGFAILAAALGFILYLEVFLQISPELVWDVKLLFGLAFLNFLLISSGTAFTAAATIKNRLDLASLFKGAAYLGEGLFLVGIFSFLSPKVYYVGLGILLSSCLMVGLNVSLTHRITPELRLKQSLFSWNAVKELVLNGIWNSINSLGNVLNSGLDLLLSNLLLSALAMGQLAIVKTISIIFSTLFQLLSQPFQPLLLKSYARNDMVKVVHTFQTGIKVCGLFSNIAFAGFIAYGMVYYRLWTPSQDIELLYALTVVTISGAIVEGAIYPLYYTYTLTRKNRIPCLVTVGAGLLKVGAVFLLIRYTDLGLYAVVGMTTLLSWGINFGFNPMYAALCLGMGRWTFYPLLIQHLLSCMAMTLVFHLIASGVQPSSWLGLLFSLLLCTVAGGFIHLTIMTDREDRDQIRRGLKRRGTS